MRKLIIALLIAATAKLHGQTVPYELKGFVVGESTLSDFKTKFHHVPNGDKRVAPLCSDDFPEARLTPGREERSDSYTKAGLVYCQPYFPFEGPLFTVADVPTTAEFDFYNSRLFSISASFLHVAFDHIKGAFIAKYGAATSETNKDYQNRLGAKFTGRVLAWDNGVSVIELEEYSSSLDISGVRFTHKVLSKEAGKAKPQPSTKDL